MGEPISVCPVQRSGLSVPSTVARGRRLPGRGSAARPARRCTAHPDGRGRRSARRWRHRRAARRSRRRPVRLRPGAAAPRARSTGSCSRVGRPTWPASTRRPAATRRAAIRWPAFLAALREHRDEVGRRLDRRRADERGRPVRGARRWLRRRRRAHGLPLRVLEVGASAGLNLRLDHFAYDTGAQVAGDPDSPVRFAGVWDGPAARPAAALRGGRASRLRPQPARRHHRGGPPHAAVLRVAGPAASASPGSRPPRGRRARAGRASNRPTPSTGSTASWPSPAPGVATVVAHSIVLQYLSADRRRRFRARARGRRRAATPSAPLAWLRMEPAATAPSCASPLWPGADEQLLARPATTAPVAHPVGRRSRRRARAVRPVAERPAKPEPAPGRGGPPTPSIQ